MKKRFLFVLALALTSLFSVFLLSSCCFPVDGGDPSATQGLEYELNEDGESYYLKGIGTASGEIVIASTYKKKPVTAIGYKAFYECTGLTSVTIPDSVTGIGEWAFYGCTGLTSVTIPDSVTGIGDDAFRGCTGLTSVTIPDSVTSIGEGAFEGCTSLTSITLPFLGSGLNGTSNIHFGYIFGASSFMVNGDYVPTSLKTVVITGDKWIGGMAFRDCTGLTSVTIPDSVTSIGSYAFQNCTGLTSVTIPDSVTSIGSHAFYYCTGLTSVTIGNSVTSIGSSAFRGCERLSEVTFKEVNGWQVNGNDLHIDTIANQREVARLLKDDYSDYSWYRN